MAQRQPLGHRYEARKTYAREGNEVHREFPHVAVQLSREAETGANTTHHLRDDAVQIVKCRVLHFASPLRDIISTSSVSECIEAYILLPRLQGFVIDTEGHVAVLHQLVY